MIINIIYKLTLANNLQRFKPIIFVLFLLNLFNVSDCLYEDQIGKFDWKTNYIGIIKFSYFDPILNDKLFIATEENVLAALDVKSGNIIWRQIFEQNERGNIQFLYVNSEPQSIITSNSKTFSNDLVTVSGYNPSIVRSWSANTGNLISEWFLTPNSPEKAQQGFWFYSENYLYNVLPVFGSHLEITGYHPFTGQQKRTTSSKILASWIDKDRCVFAEPLYACLINNQILAVDLTSDKADLFSKILNDNVMGPIKVVKGLEAAVRVGEEIISIRDKAIKIESKLKPDANYYNDKYILGNKNILIQTVVEENTIQITATHLETGTPFNDIYTVSHYPETFGTPEIHSMKCKSKQENQLVCRILISTSDGALVLMQQGKIKWIREESLTKISEVEMIDLTLSDAEGAIETELNSKEGDVFGAFFRRITGQVAHFKNLLLHIIGLGAPPSASQKAGLVRDAFGLHKIVVVVTKTGKIFGIDNISGKHIWIKYLKNFSEFNNNQHMKILIQRTSKFFPHQPYCTVVAKDSETGNGILYQFNPVSGVPINGGVKKLGFVIQQISLVHATGPDFLRGILFLDSNNNPHVLPESASKYADKFYLYSANKNTGILSGYFIQQKNNKLISTKTWELHLSGSSNSQQIVAVAGKNTIEHVHSQGRVLGDRSVLYKYINPNLIAVATHGPDSIHKYVMNIHLIDVVSGAIISSLTHRRVKLPIQIIHSENWLVYSYYNEKVRRVEMTTIELYEGKTQTNSTVWSSMEAPPLPLVERQSYIFPSNILSLRETITEKGITNKHVLIGLSNGGIVEMPWALLDPRRQVTIPNQAREEGIIPYIPELPIPQENIINYNQTIPNMKGLYTAPSGLESTCLVFAYGLDLFVTRIAPSKTFDLLKEDFDYFLISVVLIALTTASYVTKHLSSRKALKQAWK